MTVKRLLTNDTEIETMAMANCLLLSRVGKSSNSISKPDRLFHCKTCNRPFQSFQALGGHHASHKRPKVNGYVSLSPAKPKTHECSICGQEFAIGQALGGHMRRHRDEVPKKVEVQKGSESRNLFVDLDLDLNLNLNLMPYENDLKLWPIVT